MSRVLLRIAFIIVLILAAACTSGRAATGEVITLTEVPTLPTATLIPTLVENQPVPQQTNTSGSIVIPTVANVVLPDGSVASATPQRATVCNPRTDWGSYTVVSGDTLFDISLRFEVSIEELAEGNCLEDVNRLNVGQTLYVPGGSESVGTALTITPIVDQRGTVLIVEAGATVTINWADAPAGTTVEYILSNFLQDGGVKTIGIVSAGIALPLTIPDTLDGEIQAIARQGESTVETASVRLQTGTLTEGACEFYAAALGEPTQVYSSPDSNSTALGTALVDTGYAITGVVTGSQNGAAQLFYQITYNGQTGYVASGQGSLRGNCSAFQQ